MRTLARSRRWTAAVGVTALVAGVWLGVVAVGGGAPSADRANPPADSGLGLKKIQKKLQKALDTNESEPGDFDNLVDGAIADKRKWIGKAFRSQTISGCDAAWLLEHFEAIDVGLEAAADPTNKDGRKKEIENATAAANAVAVDLLGKWEKCSKPAQDEMDQAAALFDLVQELSTRKPPSVEVRKKAATRKALFIADERLYGCEATQFLAALERIDIPLAVAHDTRDEPGRSERLQRRLVKDAVGEIKKFRRYWRKVPCDDPGTGTTSTSTTTTGTGTETSTTTDPGTTTTTTPAQPACADGTDNDGDGKVDGADTGCLSMPDTTEETNVWPYHYPGDGGMGFDWIDLKPFFGSWIGTVVAYRVLLGTTPVHTSMVIDHGATPINGTKPCSSLGATGIKAGRGGAAPTGGGLPAAPDSDHLRIVIDTSDPAGGGDCGLGPVDLEVATDTRLP